MLRIHRALLTELITTLLLIVAVVTSAVFLGTTIKMLSQGMGGVGADLLLSLLPKLLPVAFAWSLPFAWQAAVAIVMTRWTSDQELTALQSAGVRARVVALPILALSAALAAGGMYFNGFIVPKASREVKAGLREMVPRFLASLRGADRSLVLSQGRISFEAWTPEGFAAVELDRRSPDGRLLNKLWAGRLKLVADAQAAGGGISMEAKDVVAVSVDDTGQPGEAKRYGNSVNMPLGTVRSIAGTTSFNDFFLTKQFQYMAKDMTLPEMSYVNARGGVARASALRARTRAHGRLSLGASTFTMALFTVAMLLCFPHSERRVRDFMATFVPCTLTFFPLYVLGPTLARSHGWPAWLALWMPNIVLVAAALVLFVIGRKR